MPLLAISDQLRLDQLKYLLTVQAQAREDGPAELPQLLQLLLLALHLLLQLPDALSFYLHLDFRRADYLVRLPVAFGVDSLLLCFFLLLSGGCRGEQLPDEERLLADRAPCRCLRYLLRVGGGHFATVALAVAGAAAAAGTARLLADFVEHRAWYLQTERQRVLACHHALHLRQRILGFPLLTVSPVFWHWKEQRIGGA